MGIKLTDGAVLVLDALDSCEVEPTDTSWPYERKVFDGDNPTRVVVDGCAPTVKELSELSVLSEREVRAAVKELRSAGLVKTMRVLSGHDRRNRMIVIGNMEAIKGEGV